MNFPKGEIEFIFQKDDGSNETIILHGELERPFIPPPLPVRHPAITSSNNASHVTSGGSNSNTTSVSGRQYDDQGALMFVVAVIVVYSLSMFFIVAALLRRKSEQKSLDGQVNQYIKGIEAAREQDKVIVD